MTHDMQCKDCAPLLDAYHDAALMPEELAAVEAHLSSCANCSQEVDAIRRTSQLLHEGLARYTAPDMLKARIHARLTSAAAEGSTEATSTLQPVPAEKTAATNRWMRLSAAAVLIAAASSAATYSAMRSGSANDTVANQVLASHVRALMPNHLIDVASNDQHNVKPWFNGRVDLSPQVPALDSAGFVLTGGRLDYIAGRSVAAIVYMRRQHVIDVYSWPDAGHDVALTTTSTNGYHLVRWKIAGVSYWAASDLNEKELTQFVSLFQQHQSR